MTAEQKRCNFNPGNCKRNNYPFRTLTPESPPGDLTLTGGDGAVFVMMMINPSRRVDVDSKKLFTNQPAKIIAVQSPPQQQIVMPNPGPQTGEPYKCTPVPHRLQQQQHLVALFFLSVMTPTPLLVFPNPTPFLQTGTGSGRVALNHFSENDLHIATSKSQ